MVSSGCAMMSFCRTLRIKKQLKLLQMKSVFKDFLLFCRFSTSSKRHTDEIRVRFAPSPTGFLHIGGLRTALLNYLFAKSRENGKFIIRIEDTDQARLVPGAVENLIDKLKWVGIVADEGPVIGGEYGPYVQSERLLLYQSHAQKLLDSGSAYRCFCSQRRIDVLRRDQIRRKEQTRYDNRCRDLSESDMEEKLNSKTPYVLRLRMDQGVKSFKDILNGRIEHDVAKIEGDPVIVKSDGFPTYHLANVVDDHLMRITHILRGKEWMISTCKHVMLYQAFGWKIPKYAHLPLLNNEDGKKLSKRQGDIFVEHFRDKGYFPTALLNFMAHFGAGFSETTGTIYGDDLTSPESALKEMASNFDLEKVETHDSVVRFWKLDEYNSKIMKHLLSSDVGKTSLIKELRTLVSNKYGNGSLLDQLENEEERWKYLDRVLTRRHTHITLLKDLISENYDYVWARPQNIFIKEEEELLQLAQSVIGALEKMDDEKTSSDNIVQMMRQLVIDSNLKMSSAMAFLRTLLIGRKQGPGVGEIIYILGRRESLLRMKKVDGCLEETDGKVLNKT